MSKSQSLNNKEVVVILNNIRSNENVGSIFRTADATGVSKIILCGYTPAPIDRFGRENKGLTKASLGAEKSVEWEKVENINLIIERLKIEKFKIVGIEQDKNAIDYRKIKTSKLLASSPARHDGASGGSKLALVFGNEVDGLSKQDLELCDVVVELPMLGNKESLNVSVCAGVVLYSLL